ncbi:MAG: hypothetical protein ABSE73_24560 [Planctomycetota bacterium]
MSVGVSAWNRELATAHFTQACCDVLNAEAILGLEEELPGAKAIALAQSQQACEKALKAWLLLAVGSDRYLRPGHQVWTVDLQAEALNRPPSRRIWAHEVREGELRNIRERVRKALGNEVIEDLSELEGYAPLRSWDHPNSEYPWVDEHGIVQVPASYFDPVMIAGLKKKALLLLDRVAEQCNALKREWLKTKAVFRRQSQ